MECSILARNNIWKDYYFRFWAIFFDIIIIQCCIFQKDKDLQQMGLAIYQNVPTNLYSNVGISIYGTMQKKFAKFRVHPPPPPFSISPKL